MLEIKKTLIESFIAPLPGEGRIGVVSLFIVCENHSRLKKLNLDHLSPEERSAQLKIWGKEHRFVLVIEKGDTVFAHAHSKYAAQLQNLDDVSLNNRKIQVVLKTLSDQEADLIAAIGEQFEKHVLLVVDNEVDDDNAGQYTVKPDMFAPARAVEEELSVVHSLSPSLFAVQKIKHDFSALILKCLKELERERTELKERLKADEKYFDIKNNEIKRAIGRWTIHQQESKQKNRADVVLQ
ncbi:MAG: hypothetical protein ACH350_04315 [Parachlamydiaceae bacterium]